MGTWGPRILRSAAAVWAAAPEELQGQRPGQQGARRWRVGGVRLDGETEAGTSSGGLAQRVGARLGSSSDSELG